MPRSGSSFRLKRNKIDQVQAFVKTETLKMQEQKTQDWKYRYESAGGGANINGTAG